MMFIVPCPSCGRCGCECGRLPYTVTATFSDLAQRNRTAECELSLSACFGSGAAGVVMQPGGCTNTPTCGCDGSDAGPITEVLLTDGGSCYAVFGREEPSLTATVAGGTGAELEVTLTESTDGCGLPVWEVTKVNVLEPGAGYSLTPITFKVVAPGVESEAAVAEVSELTPEEPLVFSLSAFGTGATFSVSVTQSGTSPDRWTISGVTVTAGGSGYFDGGPVTVEDAPPLVEEVAAVLLLRTARAAPTLDAFPLSGGSGAAFTISVVQSGSNPAVFSADSISVTSPGSGYVNGDTFQIFSVGGVTESPGFATATVDDGGGLVSLSITDGGAFYIDTGVAESVEVQSGGSYYDGDGVAAVAVSYGGKYYLENRDLPALVAEVTVTPCGGGSGASITATVDDDVNSDTFGQVTKLGIEDGGDGYLSWTWAAGCLDRLNGESLVLRANDPHELVTLEVQSCYGSGACLAVDTTLGVCGDPGSPSPLAAFPRAAPRLSLSASPGSGACLTPTFATKEDACGFDYWYITSVSVAGGTGYNDTTPVGVIVAAGVADDFADLTLNATKGVPTSVTVTDGGKFYQLCGYTGEPTPLPGVTLVSGGEGYAKRGRVEPTLALAAANGTGATLTPTLDKKADDCGLDYWYIEKVATTGGTGYADSNKVTVTVTKGVEEQSASLTLRASEGVPTEVTIERAGKYYLESNAVAAYTPTIKVAVVQLPPSVGTGAAVSVTVNTNPLDGGFGKITGVSLTNKGSDYLLFGGPKHCEYEGPCSTTLDFSGRSVVGLLTGVFEESDPQPDCGDISSETTIQRGLTAGTVNVEAGGVWGGCDDQDCGECPEQCKCGSVVTVTIEVCDETIEFSMPANGGTYGASISLEVPVADPPQGAGYIEISAASGCQSDGCGYEVGVLICYACRRALDTDPVVGRGEAFRGCVAADAEDGCPTPGAVSMVCIGGECEAIVTASVS